MAEGQHDEDRKQTAFKPTPAVGARTLVDHPGAGEAEPLGDEGHAVRQESGRPSEQDGDDTDRESFVALLTAELGELHAPVDSSEEGEDDGSVGDLDVLDQVESVERRLEVETGDGVQAWPMSDRFI